MPEITPKHPTRRWKRTAAAALLLLAGGAVLNVAVAWGCARVPLATVREEFHVLSTLDGEETLGCTYVSAWSERIVRPGGMHYQLPPELRQRLLLKRPINDWSRIRSENDVSRIYEEARGWPALSLSWNIETGTGRFRGGLAWGNPETISVRKDGIPSTQSFALVPEYHLPCTPLWPGFIINTLFYALLLWLLVFAPFAARRMLRRRRGQCEKCAYPIGVSSVCTECGAAVARRNDP